jgi:site-specific DNA-methyltransferase (adenine-specific)
LWLHLDHRAVHEAKVICDKLLPGGYRGEVIWVPGNGNKKRKSLGVTHNTILVYSHGDIKYYADRVREPFAPGSLKMHFKGQDENGRQYYDKKIGGKVYRYYADQGKALGSVWSDCPAMAANSPICPETTGYPTQKPLSLLSRIIELTTDEGDLVVDPFCGSGTTLVAARKLGRHWVGIDKSSIAVDIAEARLA